MFPNLYKNRGSHTKEKRICVVCVGNTTHALTHILKSCGFSHTQIILFCRLTPFKKKRVEHGSHNVSRWMTWLSISLKNAAACDKWYQLQNLSITESLNANGAWEKLFVSHPRACHTQCRTNKNPSPSLAKKRELKTFSFGAWGLGR